MSEYLVQRQSLENIADEIRVLSGTTEPLGLTEMATNVNDANDEVADQTDLIAQLASALQGKSVPGGSEDVTAETETYTNLLTDLEAAVEALPDAESGGSGGASIETCTMTFSNSNNIHVCGAKLTETGEIIPIFYDVIDDAFPLTVVRGAGIIFISENWEYDFLSTVVTGAEPTGGALQAGMMGFNLTSSTAHFEFVHW